MGDPRLEAVTHVFDCHDSALYAWRAAGVRALPLVHVDAHHDIEPARPDGAIDIGNFIRAAIGEGIVSEVFWAVPDPMWRDRRTRSWIRKELVFADADPLRVEKDGIRATIAGVPLRVGPIEVASWRGVPVLLDVDVDYMLHAARHPRAPQWPLAVPWCWPADVCDRLQAATVVPAVVTVATSTTGGFTPVRWQHLGREFVARWGSSGNADGLRSFDLIRAAAEDRREGRLESARGHCVAAVAACPSEPAALFHLAETEQALGHRDAARAAFDRARSLDAAYRHPFRSPGPWFLRRRRLREAADAYRMALDLDPDDPHAHAGLSLVSIRTGDPHGAVAHAERSLAIEPTAGAWRALAQARRALGEHDAAIAAYNRAMTLTLRGAIPLEGPWAANPEGRLADPWHWRDHADVAALYEDSGDLDAALVHARLALAAAPWAHATRWRVVRLYARRGDWSRAARVLAQSVRRK